jgi:ATP-dependent DNA ligase
MSRTSTLPKSLQPMLATLTDAPFDDTGWVFEDKYDGFRMIAEIRRGKVALYSRNCKIISRSYIEVAKALEGVKGDAVIDGELVAIARMASRISSCFKTRCAMKQSYCIAPSTSYSRTQRTCAGSLFSSARSG